MPIPRKKIQNQASAPWSAKPDFGIWVLLVLFAVALCFKFVPALVLALVLSVVCRPMYDSFMRKLNHCDYLRRHAALSHDLASAGTQLLTGCLITACLLAPLWVLNKDRAELSRCAQNTYTQAREWSRGQIQSLGVRFDVQEWIDFGALPDPDDAVPAALPGVVPPLTPQDQLVEMVSRPAPFLPGALATLNGVALLLGQMMFFFMALHFLFLHGPQLWKSVLAQSPPGWRPTLAILGLRARGVLLAVCLVHGLTAMCAFLLALPAFYLVVGSKHFLLLAMLAGFFQLIPLLGSVTLLSILTVFLFASGHTEQGWQCLLIATPLVVGVPDLLVRPFLSQRYGKVHGATMLAGFIIGIEVFGPLGFVLGPLLLDLVVQFTKRVLHIQIEA